MVSERVPALAFLKNADAIAASVVALIVIYVSLKMGARTIQGLLDAAPKGMVEKIQTAVEAMPGVINCHNVRVRYSGPRLFVDVHVLVNGDQSLSEAHRLTEQIEDVIRSVAPDVDVVVHPEPVSS